SVEYIEITPFEIELIKNIETIEKMRLKTIKKVFSLFANSALKAYETKITPFLFFESLIFEYEYRMN
ncbi:hypothetical protein ACN9JT_04290, partial [Aliarcobacter butzleri]